MVNKKSDSQLSKNYTLSRLVYENNLTNYDLFNLSLRKVWTVLMDSNLISQAHATLRNHRACYVGFPWRPNFPFPRRPPPAFFGVSGNKSNGFGVGNWTKNLRGPENNLPKLHAFFIGKSPGVVIFWNLRLHFKQCTIIGEIPQNSHTFVFFASPKIGTVIEWPLDLFTASFNPCWKKAKGLKPEKLLALSLFSLTWTQFVATKGDTINWLVVSTQLKNMLVKLDHFPR